MNGKVEQALVNSLKNIERNRPVIEKMLCQAGVKVSPELVFSAAKYFEALNKLAHE